MGAGSDSTTRVIAGAVLEGLWLLFWLLFAIGTWTEAKERRAHERQVAEEEESAAIAAEKARLRIVYEEQRAQANEARAALVEAARRCEQQLQHSERTLMV